MCVVCAWGWDVAINSGMGEGGMCAWLPGMFPALRRPPTKLRANPSGWRMRLASAMGGTFR